MKPGLINKIALNHSFDEELNKIIVKAGAMVANANNEAICKAIIQYAKDNGVTELNIIDKATLNQAFEDAVKYRKIKTIEVEIGIKISVLIKLFKKLNRGSIYTNDDFKHGWVWDIDVEKHTITISNLDSWKTESKTYNFCDYKKVWWLKKDKSE